MLTKNPKDLQTAIERIVAAVGTPPDNATVVANLLVRSHLAGHDSHGIQHLPRYVREAQAGEIVAAARPTVISEKAGVTHVRGNWAWGHVTADFVTRLGIAKARQNGIALITAVEVNHIGRLGDYVERAAAEGVVAMLVSGGHSEEAQTAAPYGGSKALLAPNPIAISFPTGDDHPIVVDFATTEVAGGKIALANAKGEAVPLGWIIDREGNPATKPNDYYNGGALLPFGAHKGFGIMVAIEVFGRILTGADNFSATSHGGTYFRHAGISLIAVDSGVVSSADQFAGRAAELGRRIRAVPPAPGFDGVQAPGDFEYQSRARRVESGIPIPESTWNEVVETADSLGIRL